MKILSALEKTGIHTLSIHIVRSIAEQHGGSIRKKPGTNSVGIVVPEDKKADCSDEISKQLGAMQEHLTVLLIGCICGKMIIKVSRN